LRWSSTRWPPSAPASLGGRQFHSGTLHGVETVAVFSRWGKVAAAATVTQRLASYAVDEILFTGVASGIQRDLSIGDVVVATELIQHDLDASPIFPRYEVPLLGRSRLATDPGIYGETDEGSRGIPQP